MNFLFVISLLIQVTIIFMLKFICGQVWPERRPLVTISQGLLEGTTEYSESRKLINSFLGVPYANPPINNYRFTSPRKHFGWNGTYKATRYGPRCPQIPQQDSDDEDCLYLNIWSPLNPINYAPLPVVIFFEGSNFAQSSNLKLSGEDFAAEGFVIVTVNYRLNIFGFFCLGTAEARGNLGLLDQYYAILWVKENIHNFGGDPEKLTLFGYASGAVSVTLHLISPRTAGLFQRAIVSSGSATSPWQLDNDPVVASREVLKILGCYNLYINNYLSCLKSKGTNDILRALKEYSDSYRWTDQFLPVIDTFLSEDNRYLPYSPITAFREAAFSQVPILTGISKPMSFPQLDLWYDLASQGFQQLQRYVEKAKIPEILELYQIEANNTNWDQIFEIIKWKYTSASHGDVRILLDQLKNMEFEATLEAPHALELTFLASYVQPIYDYRLPDLQINVNNITDSLVGTEIILLFGPSFSKLLGRRGFVDDELSIDVRRNWYDFIVFGNPTPNHNLALQWRKYTPNERYTKHFGGSNKINRNIITERSAFWNNLLPKLSKYQYSFSNFIPKELLNTPDPAANIRRAMYTLIGLIIALLGLLIICIILLKRRQREGTREFHIGY